MDWVSHLLGKGFMDKVFPRGKKSQGREQHYKAGLQKRDFA